MHDETIYAERALRARANGYIMKQEATEKVLTAIRRILKGEIYLSERMANKLLHQYVSGAAMDMSSRLGSLSDRELEVFRLIGEGRGTRQIAEKLHLSIKTVETYQAHIKDKLSLRSGRELVQHAIQSTIGDKTP
jgi:DNA-binding NarL/FixJ family response regulator